MLMHNCLRMHAQPHAGWSRERRQGGGFGKHMCMHVRHAQLEAHSMCADSGECRSRAQSCKHSCGIVLAYGGSRRLYHSEIRLNARKCHIKQISLILSAVWHVRFWPDSRSLGNSPGLGHDLARKPPAGRVGWHNFVESALFVRANAHFPLCGHMPNRPSAYHA